ncbi:hypothetical protein ACFP63_03415 [Oerskovia jenensis]|uniref:DUF732 domain-containing protein n=1 Tax=Oerskovia jenensis TaxID=162169 RepID=A0ABS2LC39_9CELL|nr:hypothetical protein [Oerskovia jenensis]MBM7477995.1 hypothetical protein [Oerskovia jenensis]
MTTTSTTDGPGGLPQHEDEPGDSRRWILYTAAALLAVAVGLLMAVLYTNYHAAQDRELAEQRAAELHAEFEAIGITAFDEDQIVAVLGADGGGFCTDPAALVKATANLGSTNGATGPGSRPSLVDERRLAGDRLVIEVYCPEQLDDFDAYVDSLNLDENTTTPEDS